MLRYLFLLTTITFVSVACNDTPEPPTKVISAEEKEMDSLSVQIGQAKSFQEAGQYDKALAIADQMLEQYPGQLDAIGIKVDILKEQGKEKESLLLLEKAYSLQPRDKETVYNLAYAYAEAENPNALSLTDTLIKYDKTETVARAWYIKATYYNNTGNEKQALRFYDSSNLADYNFLDTYLDKGKLLLKQKKYEQALRTFATGQKFSPGTADFYFWVGKTQEAMNQKADAKMNYERAYALDKSFTKAKEAAERL